MPGHRLKLKIMLNEKEILVDCLPDRRLIDILRIDLELKGTREGCSIGECGACLVLLNGTLVNACLVPAFMLVDAELVTIDAYDELKLFAPVRKIFGPDSHTAGEYADQRSNGRPVLQPGKHSVQHSIQYPGTFPCGFCSSGVKMALSALFLSNLKPGRQEVRETLRGILCRCASYETVEEQVMGSLLPTKKKSARRLRTQ